MRCANLHQIFHKMSPNLVIRPEKEYQTFNHNPNVMYRFINANKCIFPLNIDELIDLH